MSGLIDHSSVLQWGERNGALHYVDAVDNGDKCDCICSYCRSPLIAKNKGKIKIHHFAHAFGHDCEKAIEYAVHKLAKQVLANTRKLLLPPCEGYGPHGPKDYILETLIEFDHIETEVNIEIDGEIIRPDAIGYFGTKRIFIEFCFTHSVSDLKAELIKKSNTSCVEIFLELSLQEPGRMEALLHDSLDLKKWIFHRALERLVLADREQERERIKAREKRLAEQDRQRRIREEAKRQMELEKQRKQREWRRRMEEQWRAREEKEHQKKNGNLQKPKQKATCISTVPLSVTFLKNFLPLRGHKMRLSMHYAVAPGFNEKFSITGRQAQLTFS